MATDITHEELETTAELLALIEDPAGREVYDPATNELIGRTGETDAAGVDDAVVRARKAQQSWALMTHESRSDFLHKVADAIESVAEPLAELLSREQGKPLNGPNARFEVDACASWLRAHADFVIEPEVLVDDESGRAEMHYVPVGVVGAVGPWNWPMMISVWQMAPALRMGNAVILKPSEYTPLSVQALVAVMNSVLPVDIVQIVSGGGEIGQALVGHQGVDKVMFTGSVETGKKIMRSAADNLSRLTLELGGNDAGIVLEDAEPEKMAEDLFWGAFINTGQTCAAMKRLYVPASLYERVCDTLVEFAKNMPMGNGLDESNVLGPLQNRAQYDIVERLVEAAKNDGATVLLGGDPDNASVGNFYPTTLVADIDNNNPLVSEEQFGPVLPIIKYDDINQAIEWANGLEVGLGASVWGENSDELKRVASLLEAGSVWLNKHGAIDPRVPFGGVKQSGFGLEFGVDGLKQVALPKVISW